MRIDHVFTAEELIVSLTGELDERSGGYARLMLDSIFDGAAVKRIRIDMSGVSFMDSTGIGVLIGRYKRVQPRGIPIIIQSPSPAADRVLGLSGIYNIMTKAG